LRIANGGLVDITSMYGCLDEWQRCACACSHCWQNEKLPFCKRTGWSWVNENEKGWPTGIRQLFSRAPSSVANSARLTLCQSLFF